MVDSILEQKNSNWISQGETVKKHLSKATKDLLDTLHLSFSTMEKMCTTPLYIMVARCCSLNFYGISIPDKMGAPARAWP